MGGKKRISSDLRILGAYVDRLGERPPAFRAALEALEPQVRLEPSTTSVTLMAAHADEPEIGRAILAYKAMRRDLARHQIVVLVNAAGSEIGARRFSTKCTEVDRTLSSVRARCPELDVLLVHHRFESRVPIGFIRGVLGDALAKAALARNMDRLAIVWNDADQLALCPRYLTRIVEVFARAPSVRLVSGPVYMGYAPTGRSYLPHRVKLPELFLIARLVTALGDAIASPALASNMAFRLSAYCEAGGFDVSRSFAEDRDLVFRIGRQGPARTPGSVGNELHRYVPDLFVVSDPRRELELLVAPQRGGGAAEPGDWQTVAGKGFESERAYRRYAEDGSLLQLRDIVAARDGDDDSRAKIATVLEQLVMTRLPADLPLRMAVARAFGIWLELTPEDDRGRRLVFRWNKSSILRVLDRWAGDGTGGCL